MTKAYEDTGISSGSIVGVCKGRTNHAGGFVWLYVDENPNEVNLDPEEEGFKRLEKFPHYWVSDDGRLYTTKQHKFMKFQKHANGGLQVQLTKAKKGGGQIKQTVQMHNVVGQYFLEKTVQKKGEKPVNCVSQKNGDKTNNDVSNLVWKYIGGAGFKPV